MQIFPSDSVDMSELLGEIRRERLVDIYTVDSIEYLQIINFDKHQKIDKRTASKLPANANYQPTPSNPTELPRIPTTEGKGMEGNGMDMEKDSKDMGAFAPSQPSDKKPSDGLPDCPHERIVDLFHQKLPELPRIAKWTESRKASLRSRWRELAKDCRWLSADDGMKWFEEFFDSIRESDFLMGRAKASGDRPPFVATLDWTLSPSNFIKIIEGKYHS
jgi:hypothetical protein